MNSMSLFSLWCSVYNSHWQLNGQTALNSLLCLPKAELESMDRSHRIVNLVSQEWACSSGSEFLVFGGI